MAPVPRLALIILAVRDLPRALSFYRHVFDWPILVQVPVYAEFRLPDGQRLGLYDREGFGRNTGQTASTAAEGQTASTELYFYAEDVSDLCSRLEAAGARILSPLAARTWGDEAAYYADPDGNVIAVARPAVG
jgi:predicted enzyme related to lactoylglutathione lyase